jgi:hypothetical protein
MYRLLVLLNAPEFYDKLLCVPLLNVTVIWLDAVSERVTERFRSLVHVRVLQPRQANWAWMSVWVALFAVLTSTGFLSKGKDHPGGDPEYWHRACLQGKPGACSIWTRTLNADCEGDSSSSCLKLGEVLQQGQVVPRDLAGAGISLGRACDLNSAEACAKLADFASAGGDRTLMQSCKSDNGAACFILGTLYSAGKGVPQDAHQAFELFEKSCDTGWGRGCGRLGLSYQVGQGTDADPLKALENFDKGCDEHNAASCYQAAEAYWQGAGQPRDASAALDRLNRACDLGLGVACEQRSKLSPR